MKKWIAVIIVAVMLLLTGCNYNLIDTKWNYTYAYIKYGDWTERVEITSWSEDDTTFTIQTRDGRVICSSQYNIILTVE